MAPDCLLDGGRSVAGQIGDEPHERSAIEFRKAQPIRQAPAGASFLGRVSEAEKSRLLASAHVLAVPSRREGWGLVVTEASVVKHSSNIFMKLGLSSRSEATAYAFKHGLVR